MFLNAGDIIKRFVPDSSERSKEAGRNIILSLCTKCVTVLVSLMLVPLTISYVNPSQYGVWLTITSVVGWIAFVDLGLGNGFRNKYAEAKANGDMELARDYLSTAYFAIAAIVVVVFAIILFANNYIDWKSILKLPDADNSELGKVFIILVGFFCMSMVVNLFSTLLIADQKPGFAASVNAGGQLSALVVIWIMTKVSTGSLVNLAFCLSGVPLLFTIIVSFIAFRFSRYRKVAPSIKRIRPGLIGDILSLGISFFLIFICMLVVFQFVNLVLIRELGPDAVTQFNVSQKYFNILYSIVLIVLTPFWSAFTDAYTKKDYSWMKRVTTVLEKLWLVSIAVGIIMLFPSRFAYRILSHGQVEIPLALSVSVLVYVLLQIAGNIYMYLINGIGTVRLQLLVYLTMAIISWPLLNYGCRCFGICGIVIAPSLAFLLQAIIGRIQLGKLIDCKAYGIWAK